MPLRTSSTSNPFVLVQGGKTGTEGMMGLNEHRTALYNDLEESNTTSEGIINAFQSFSDLYLQLLAIVQAGQALTQMAAARQEEDSMDWQEKYLDKLDRDMSDIKSSLKATEERIAQMIHQTLSEMRDRDNQRHQEIISLRQDIQAIRSDNAETRRWVIGMVISAIGVALAAILGIASVVYQVFK